MAAISAQVQLRLRLRLGVSPRPQARAEAQFRAQTVAKKLCQQQIEKLIYNKARKNTFCLLGLGQIEFTVRVCVRVCRVE